MQCDTLTLAHMEHCAIATPLIPDVHARLSFLRFIVQPKHC